MQPKVKELDEELQMLVDVQFERSAHLLCSNLFHEKVPLNLAYILSYEDQSH